MENLIGTIWKYRNSKNLYEIKDIGKFKVLFTCGHWCTDNIFKDLICVKGKQLNLF